MEKTIDRENIINNLKGLNAKFKNLNKSQIDETLWNEIYKNQLYEINKHMLESYFDKKNFWKKSYTYIDQEPIISDYIDANIGQYFKLVLQSIPRGSRKGYFQDNLSIVKKLLNNKNIDFNDKCTYISLMKTCIDNLSDIEDRQIWNVLIKNECVQKTVDTIIKYFCSIEETESKRYDDLLTFIDSIPELDNLDFSAVDWALYPNMKYNFYKLIISTDQLERPANNIVRSATDLKYEIKDLSKHITPSYIKIMIENDILKTSASNYQAIIDRYNEDLPFFIEKNCKPFCDFLKSNAIKFTETNLTAILCNEDTSLETKLSIVKAYRGQIKYNSMYPNEVLLEIFKNHFAHDDLGRFFDLYDKSYESDANFANELLQEFIKYPSINDAKTILRAKHSALYLRLQDAGVLEQI